MYNPEIDYPAAEDWVHKEISSILRSINEKRSSFSIDKALFWARQLAKSLELSCMRTPAPTCVIERPERFPGSSQLIN